MKLLKIIQRAQQATDAAIAALRGLTHRNPELKMQIEQLQTSSAQLGEAAAELMTFTDAELHPEHHAPGNSPPETPADKKSAADGPEGVDGIPVAAVPPVAAADEKAAAAPPPVPAAKVSTKGPGPDEKGPKGAKGVKGVK